MPKQYRKKPIAVEAVQWTGANVDEMIAFTGYDFHTVDPQDRGDDPDTTAAVFDKLHGTWVHVYDGQWIIRGIQGEFYPCADDVFTATYEQLPDGN